LADLQAERRDIVIDGKRLETLRYFSAQPSSTIVMLHEGLGSITMWRDFPQQLAQRTGCGLLLYSRYGHGKSQRLAEKRTVDFMHHEADVVLPELLHYFQIDRPIVLGHSDGGSIALIHAATHPNVVRGLILEAPHVFVEDFGLRSIKKIGELYDGSQLRTSLRRYHDHPDEMFWGWNHIWLDPEFRSWNIEAYLDGITCPLLVIQGERDEYGTVAHVQAITTRMRGAESLLLSNCGHAPHRDQTAITLDAISRFIASLPQSC
jgi:pimeloyl-ACP methyl ester carboxylesterase